MGIWRRSHTKVNEKCSMGGRPKEGTLLTCNPCVETRWSQAKADLLRLRLAGAYCSRSAWKNDTGERHTASWTHQELPSRITLDDPAFSFCCSHFICMYCQCQWCSIEFRHSCFLWVKAYQGQMSRISRKLFLPVCTQALGRRWFLLW